MSAVTGRLAALQRWFHAVATHPAGVEAGAARPAALAEEPGGIAAAVRPSRELSAVERVSVYANMYVWRLADILAEDFPTTLHVVGAERFGALAREYVAAHPSTSFTLNAFGARFPAFLRDEAQDVPERELAHEVALLERTIEEVFAERHEEPLETSALAAMPPEEWASARLRTIAALRILETRYPVNEYLRAVRAGESPAPPEPDPRRTVVWRRSWRVWRTDLSAARHAILSQLSDGCTLGEALSSAANLPGNGGDELSRVGSWFEDWTREGMFAGCRV